MTTAQSNAVLSIQRAYITTDEGTNYPQRWFVFRSGVCAIWTPDPAKRFIDRLFYFTDCTFTQSRQGRVPHTLTLSDGKEWQIVAQRGSCATCGSPLKRISMDQLLDPANTHLP